MAEALRLAEFLAALSLATDLGMGQPLEQALRTCLIAPALGQRLDLEPDDLIGRYRVRRCSGQARNRIWMAAQVRGSRGSVGQKD
jgi:hypothetical protein